MIKLHTFLLGGIHPDEHKITAEMPLQQAPLPEVAVLPLNQHIGAPAKPVVKRGDKVKVGTLIAEAGGYVSAPVYSSVSGTVERIDNFIDASGYARPAIAIRREGDDWEDSIDRSDELEEVEAHSELTPKLILERIQKAGITGMGGAGFPTHVKLVPPPGQKADCLVINGVECEPYITSDYRLMMEHADELVEGIRLLMLATGVNEARIGIEANKPKAIELLQQTTADDDSINVVPLAMKYPQGGEKQLIQAVLGRAVPPPPAIPVNVGAIVVNVGTTLAVYQAVMKNKPLFERFTTVSGAVPHPGNYVVRMGTSFGELINVCGGLPEGSCKVLAGGPMMGRAVSSVDVTVCKGTNAITVLAGSDAVRQKPTPCIRCGKCVEVCPMGLEPYLMATLSAKGMYNELEENMVTSCIACGSCQYTCPAHRPLLDYIQQGKATVMQIIKQRNKKP